MQILRLCALLLVCAVVLVGKALAQGQVPDLSLELVDPKMLRVCADPNNMPFSTDRGEGFENKLAEILAAQLGKGLASRRQIHSTARSNLADRIASF